MIRSLIAVITLVLAAAAAHAQPDETAKPPASTLPRSKPEFPGKPELLRRVALYEAAARNAAAEHATRNELVKIYVNLGALYEDLAMYLKSEDAMRRVISLLQNGPQDQLAGELGHLAILHSVMGNMKQAEKDDMQALRIREAVGDPVGIALTWNDLADLYGKQRQFKKALGYAQKSMNVIGNNSSVDPSDRIAVRQTFAIALCGVRECDKAIPLLKEAVELSKANFGADNMLVGVDQYLLGFAYWHCGDINSASELMARGIARMKVDLGWGHVIYVNAVAQYAKFLRQSGQVEEAKSAESEVRQAKSLVDARSFTR